MTMASWMRRPVRCSPPRDPANRLQQHADRDFLVLEFFQLLGKGFDRALNVVFLDHVEALGALCSAILL